MLSLSQTSSIPSLLLTKQPPPMQIHMANSLYKTLTQQHTFRMLTVRAQSSISKPATTTTTIVESTATTASTDLVESVTVERIEDAIHGIVVRRSAPDWLPFVPGSSYWVPPRKPGGYGIAPLLDKLANNLNQEELMALTTSRGWPSSAFFLLNNNDNNKEPSSVEDEENN